MKNLRRLFLHVPVVILTNGSCKIFKDSCKNPTRLFLHVLVVILTNGSCKIFKDSCMNYDNSCMILTHNSCKIIQEFYKRIFLQDFCKLMLLTCKILTDLARYF